MAKTAIINARIDPELKDAGNRILSTIGLTPSAAITLLYKTLVLKQGLPIDLHIPNEKTINALQEKEYYAFEDEAALETWLNGEVGLEDFTLKTVSKRSEKDEKARKIIAKRKKSDRPAPKRKAAAG